MTCTNLKEDGAILGECGALILGSHKLDDRIKIKFIQQLEFQY